MLQVQRRTSLKGWNDFPRVVSVYDFWHWVRQRNLTRPRKLLVLFDDPEVELLQPKERVRCVYDDTSNSCDLHQLTPPMLGPVGTAPPPDFVVLGQTLEHLHDPRLALRNLQGVLADGAHLFASVPLTSIPHMTPLHFQHFTATGLAALLESAGFEVLDVAQWGSQEYEAKLFRDEWWPGFWHLDNLAGDPDHADQVWALARKRVSAPEEAMPPQPASSANVAIAKLPHPELSLCELKRFYSDVILPAAQRGRPTLAAKEAAPEQEAQESSQPAVSTGGHLMAMAAHDLSVWATDRNLTAPRKLLTFGRRAVARPLVEALRPSEVEALGAMDLQEQPLSLGGRWSSSEARADFAVLAGALERLPDVDVAMASLCQALVPGGHVFAMAALSEPLSPTTDSVVEESAFDMQRFTAMGLIVLLQRSGFEVLELGQWGSEEYEAVLFGQRRHPSSLELSNPEGDFFHVDAVWALARRVASPCPGDAAE